MPWNDNNGNRGPWGQQPRGPQGPGGGGQNQPPDLEELLRQGRDRFKGAMPSGGFNAGMVTLIISAFVLGWFVLGGGVFRVADAQRAVVLLFGESAGQRDPGLHFWFPYPVGEVVIADVDALRQTRVGLSESRGRVTNIEEESLMLTGDRNIIDIDFDVFWQVNTIIETTQAGFERDGLSDFLFNMQNPSDSVKAVAESVMREVVGRNEMAFIRADGRTEIAQEVRNILQVTLDSYGAGVNIVEVTITEAELPTDVKAAEADVQAAEADANTSIQQGRRYANEKIPDAQGQAARVRNAAAAYRDGVVAEAAGEAQRFLAIYNEYQQAPEVTRQRIFLETLEGVYAGKDKIILDTSEGGDSVVPYLPLNQLTGARSQTQ